MTLHIFLSPGEEGRGGKERKGFPKTTTSFWAEQDRQGMENRDGDTQGLSRRGSARMHVRVGTKHPSS